MQQQSTESSAGPLAGLRVIDFSRVLAGPLCGRTLADLGAEVIKIEPPRPDVSRVSFPFSGGMSGYYAQQNIGKRNISIDLNVAGARDLAMKLCETADIVVENFRAGTLRSFGLDYEAVAKVNPRVIYVSITGYGQAGPWAGRMAYAPTVQAEAGFTSNTLSHFGIAQPEGRTDALSHADVYAGLQATIALLAALRKREITGRGQYIDVAMAAVLMSVNERAHIDLAGVDTFPEPPVLGATSGAFFRAPDGGVFVTAQSLVGTLSFPSYLRAMRRGDLARDPRFCTTQKRVENQAALHQIIQTWMDGFRDIATLDAQLDEAKIAMGQIRSLKELGESEWSEYWGGVLEVSNRRGGTYKLHGRPWRFSDEPLQAPREPAFRGEHNREVLLELGYSATEIGGYVDAGVLVSDVPGDLVPAAAEARP